VEGICTEDSPLNAVSLYGDTKKVAEIAVRDEPNTISYRFATGFGVSPCMRVNLLVNDFTHQAMTNKCLNIFQADFRRTFIHVRDMSRAFIFGLKNYSRMSHNIYNVGANNLNWTKRELAEYIAGKTGAFVNYAETGKDLDQRDYEVDYSRIKNNGFGCSVTMEQGIDELMKVVPLLQIRHQYA
jgi:nucleoside-diphosphate-sugar epimerase